MIPAHPHHEPTSSHDTHDTNRTLHQVGNKVADALGLASGELALIPPLQEPPRWTSRLRVGELAFDSVALASLALSLAGIDRGVFASHEVSVTPDPHKVQASFGSEKLFRLDGSAPTIWAGLSGFWKVRDGWVRTHGNYPHHAQRLARLLEIAPDAPRGEVEAAMQQWSRLELEQHALAAGALAIAVRTPAEWQDHPQYPSIRHSPILHYAAVGDAPPRSWPDTATLPLTGVRVLDLTRVIAGPVATRDLALAGADVLRIDAPQLPEAAWQHLDTGQGKRTALLDLDQPQDRAQLDQLLLEADVVVHGYRPAALEKYGLDVKMLHQRFPGLIVAQLSAWGTHGPWGQRRGFDSLVQAASGIAVLESKDDGATPGALPVQALDHSAGHFLAAAVATALRAQRSTGGSFEISISLAQLAEEFLSAGPVEKRLSAASVQHLPTVSVELDTTAQEAPVVMTCAPPVLAFPEAFTEYQSPVHSWGTDVPFWQ